MEYTGVVFTLVSGEDYQRDLFIDALAGIGFDTFEDTESGFAAYQPADSFDEAKLDELVASYRKAGLAFSYTISSIPQENWNEVWESNFEPIQVDGKCYIRATFHEPRPDFPFEIVIDPKMAFGTGHHQTTATVISYLLEEKLEGSHVLDMGCGTAILAILAAKAGAANVVAIDNDPVCFDSSQENCRLNNTPSIRCLCGSEEVIPDELFDLVIANINRNILLEQLPAYSGHLAPGGVLLLSGFYEPDLVILSTAAEKLGLVGDGYKKSGEWIAARFIKLS